MLMITVNTGNIGVYQENHDIQELIITT